MDKHWGWHLSSFLAGCTLCSSIAAAGDISAYLPIKQSPEIERQVERLMVMADMPILIKPFRVADVQRALEKGCDTPSKVCSQVEEYLQRYQRSLRLTQASGAVSYADDDDIAGGKFLPNQRGITTDSNYQASGQAQAQWGGHFIATAGAIAYDSDILPTAYVTAGWDFAQLDVGWRDYWYSPFQDSAMLYSTNARVSPSIALSNSKPLTFLNFRYEMFLTKLETADGILFQEERTSGRPYIFGIHLEFEPLPGWSLGLNRTLQYGGDGRDSSFDSFIDAFFDPSGNDNRVNVEDADDEFGNQIASISSRFNFTGEIPFSVYMEYAGEDTSTGENYRLGNIALSLGVFFPVITENIDLTYEFSDWQNRWYVNNIYGDGYTNERSIIGHWAANERVFGDGVGAQVHTLKANWDIGARSLLHATYRTVDNGEYATSRGVVAKFDYVRSHELQLRYSYQFSQYFTGVDLYVGRTTFDEKFVNIGAFLRW